eukprot:SAG31_NODE_54_length_29987_cov_4.570664_6_plen_104_part_00
MFVSRPLVPPLNRSSADQPNARKAVAGARVEGWEVEDGRIFLRHSSTVSNKDGNRSYSMPDTDAVFFVAVRAVTFSFLRQLFEKYGTLIERSTALIEKVSPCR